MSEMQDWQIYGPDSKDCHNCKNLGKKELCDNCKPNVGQMIGVPPSNWESIKRSEKS